MDDHDEPVKTPRRWRPDPRLVGNAFSKRIAEHDREKVRQVLELGYFPDDPKWLRS